jgi:hypothetical protein
VDVLARIEARLVEVDNGMETPCLVWTGGRNGPGYGQMSVGGRKKTTHVPYYEETVGPKPPGKVLDHTCPEKACVRHTEPVTQRENVIRGRVRRGLRCRSSIPG